MGKRVLVTGGTGFVGANLVRRLLRDQHQVTLLIRPESSSSPWRLAGLWLNHLLSSLIIDLRSPDLGRELQKIRPEWIFHLAQHGGYPWQTDPEEITRTNLIGSLNLLNAAASVGFEAFVNSGSSTEYGPKDHAPDEDEVANPRGLYAGTKLKFTEACVRLAQKGAHITTLRLYSAYGPWEEPRRLVPQLVTCGLDGRLPLLGNPRAARDYVYVEDVVDAYLVAVNERSGVYNVGSGIQTSLDRVVGVTQGVFGLPLRTFEHWGGIPDRDWDTEIWVADISRLRAAGWEPKISLAQGLGLTAEWLTEHPELWERYGLSARRTLAAIPGPSSPISASR